MKIHLESRFYMSLSRREELKLNLYRPKNMSLPVCNSDLSGEVLLHELMTIVHCHPYIFAHILTSRQVQPIWSIAILRWTQSRNPART